MAAPRNFPLLDRIAASPGRAFATVMLLHAAVWTALPALLYPNLPLDLIEALIYGREWQLGYDKLPPLPWWLVEIVYLTIGHDFAYYLLAQVAVVAALACVWAMARPLVGAARRAGRRAHCRRPALPQLHRRQVQPRRHPAAVLGARRLCLSSRLARRRNPALAAAGPRASACRCGRNISSWCWRCRSRLFLVIDRDARKSLATPGPYLALAAALVVMAPHLVWLVQNDFLPFAYAEHRALPSRGLIDHVWHPLQFGLSQLFFLIPSLLIALPLFYPRRSASEPTALAADAFDYRIVTWLAFGPMATVLALSALSGRGTVAMWGYPLWLFLGVWLVLIARRALDALRLGRVLLNWAIVFAGLAIAFIGNYGVLPYYDHRYRAVFFPGGDMGRELSQRYRAVTGKPIVYVIGSMWDGGNVAHYAPEHPRVLIDGKPERAPWIDLADLRAHGAVVVWTVGDLHAVPVELRTIAADAAVQPPFLLHYRRGTSSLYVGWAILLPRPSYAGGTNR